MVIGQIWINANPELRGHLRKANEERSAAYYATWRAVTAPFRGFIEAVRRVRRERETYHALTLTWSPRPSSPPSAASSKPSMPRTT